MMSELKNKIINGIIDVEGGYVNDPNDSGGETNYGITKKVAIEFGYTGSMKALTQYDAFAIYSDKYWNALRLDDICEVSFDIAEELADTGINMGISRAGKFIQRSVNVLNNRQKYYPDLLVDGAIGDKTIASLIALVELRGLQGINVILSMLNSLQGEFYISLAERREKDESFIYGWFKNRVIK